MAARHRNDNIKTGKQNKRLAKTSAMHNNSLIILTIESEYECGNAFDGYRR